MSFGVPPSPACSLVLWFWFCQVPLWVPDCPMPPSLLLQFSSQDCPTSPPAPHGPSLCSRLALELSHPEQWLSAFTAEDNGTFYLSDSSFYLGDKAVCLVSFSKVFKNLCKKQFSSLQAQSTTVHEWNEIKGELGTAHWDKCSGSLLPRCREPFQLF